MAFDTTHYLSWYVPRIRREDGALNLHASGVAPLEPEDLEIPEGNPWLMALAFENKLSKRLGCAPEEVLFTSGATGGTLFYEDADGDGQGTPDATIEACDTPDGYADNALDCDDTNPTVLSFAVVLCDGLDNDCDG